MSVKPLFPEQFIVRSFFLYPSVVQDDYPVGILNGLESVGNSDDGTSFDKRVDGFLHLYFVFGVERSGRFVQQDDWRVFQNGAGYGYALLLAARQGAASFAYHRVVALRQAHDEVVATGFLGCGDDFLEASA